MALLAAGSIRPYISHQLPLEQTADALNLIKERKVIGKAVLGRAMALRRKLRALKKERRLPDGLQEEMAAQLLPEQLLQIRVAA